MSAEPTERPWRRRLQRYGPWVVAAVAIAAILVKYPPERIAAEMTQGDLAGTVPYAALLVFGGIFLLSASDWLVINGAMQPPDEARVSYLHATRARAGMSLRKPPRQPGAEELRNMGRKFPPNHLHESWVDFLYWDAELEA